MTLRLRSLPFSSLALAAGLLAATGAVSAEPRKSTDRTAEDVAADAVRAKQALSDCLVSSVDADDKRVLVEWIFGVLSRHPDVKPLTRIDDAQYERITRRASDLVTSLLAERCTAQFAEVARKSGTEAIGESFEKLGETAMSSLLEDGAVRAASADIAKYADPARIERALKDK
ncbi:MAG: hypothetical protein ACTHOH_15995 [Lysobacteraceae bacterium]